MSLHYTCAFEALAFASFETKTVPTNKQTKTVLKNALVFVNFFPNTSFLVSLDLAGRMTRVYCLTSRHSSRLFFERGIR